MDIVERQIKILTLDNGKCPFEEWFDGVSNRKALAVIIARLTRVRAGNFGVCEPVGEGVYELKIDYGPGYRVYLATVGRIIVVLLGGGDKKTQPADIKKAQEIWETYGNDPERFLRDLRI